MEYKLDMSMMFAMHDALRRELVQVARIAGQPDGNPARRLQATVGWELFKKFLLVHHQSEDDTLWPVLRARVAGQPGRGSSLRTSSMARRSVAAVSRHSMVTSLGKACCQRRRHRPTW